MGRIVPDLDVQDSGQAAEALCADTQGVDLLEQFQTQLFDPVAGPRSISS